MMIREASSFGMARIHLSCDNHLVSLVWCSSGQPLTIHLKQIDNSSCEKISWHSSAKIVKHELDFKLCSNFLSNRISMVLIILVALNLDVYWAFRGCSLKELKQELK